jgi:two-component system, OmpR family, response regulator MtrA
MEGRILVVDDDPTLARVLARGLVRAGFEVSTASNGPEAFALFRESEFDLIVLDLMLPGMDGIDVCRTIRHESPVPILILSGKSDTLDIVVALEVGADDYVNKPAPVPELAARIRALLRRVERRERDGLLQLGPLCIDVDAFTVTKNDIPVELPLTEFRLLVELARRPGRAMTRDELLERVWDYKFLGDSRLVDMAVKRLRERIEDDPKNPDLIQTVRGVGYRFKLPRASETASGKRAQLLVLIEACRDLQASIDWMPESDARLVGLKKRIEQLSALVDNFVATEAPTPPTHNAAPPGHRRRNEEPVRRTRPRAPRF